MALIGDPVGDMITRIRNGHMRSKECVTCPNSRMRRDVLKVLRDEGYISGFSVYESSSNKSDIKIDLKYYLGNPVIKKIKRISKPGLHLYCRCKDIPKCNNGLGVVILSTSCGVMSDNNARKANVGGEILCEIF